MRQFFLTTLCLFILVSCSFSTTPTFGNAACGGASATSFTITLSPSTGALVVLGISYRTTTTTISSITDNGSGGSSTYAHYISRSQSTNVTGEMWATTAAKASVTTITVNFGATTKAEGCASYYTGVNWFPTSSGDTVLLAGTQTGIAVPFYDSTSTTVGFDAGAGSNTVNTTCCNPRVSGNGGGGGGSTQAFANLIDLNPAVFDSSIGSLYITSSNFVSMQLTFDNASPPGSGIYLVRDHVSDGWPTTTSVAETAYYGAAAGNLLVISVADDTSAGTVSSLADSNGTPSTAKSNVTNTANLAIFYEANNTSGLHTFTPTFASTTTNSLHVMEFAGIATSSPFDVAVSNTGTGSSQTSGTLTPATTGELAVNWVSVHANTVPVAGGFGAAKTFTPRSDFAFMDEGQYNLISVGTNPTFSVGGVAAWVDITVAFKAPAVASCSIFISLMGVGCR